MIIHNNVSGKKRVVIFTHVDTPTKETSHNFSMQELLCTLRARKIGNCEIVRVFTEISNYQKRKDRPVLLEAIKYCENQKNRITFLIAFSQKEICSDNEEFKIIKEDLKFCGIECIISEHDFSFYQKGGLIK